MFFEFIKQKFKITDISFANVFLKKLVIRLIIILFVSAFAINIAQDVVVEQQEILINNQMSNLAINLAQLQDKNFDNDTNIDISNKMLSYAYEEINSNQYVSDSSLSFYDLTSMELISKSSELFLLDSDEALDWWKQQTNNQNGIPTINLSDEMKDFYKAHDGDYDIYIKSMTCVNSVLFPSTLSARNKDGKEIASCSATVPSINSAKDFSTPIRLINIGCDSNGIVFRQMGDFTFIKSENENGTTKVQYDNDLFGSNIDLKSQEFEINDSNYKVDCGYNISFWYGAWEYVLMFEIIALLWCALSAFLNTKESFLIYK